MAKKFIEKETFKCIRNSEHYVTHTYGQEVFDAIQQGNIQLLYQKNRLGAPVGLIACGQLKSEFFLENAHKLTDGELDILMQKLYSEEAVLIRSENNYYASSNRLFIKDSDTLKILGMCYCYVKDEIDYRKSGERYYNTEIQLKLF